MLYWIATNMNMAEHTWVSQCPKTLSLSLCRTGVYNIHLMEEIPQSTNVAIITYAWSYKKTITYIAGGSSITACNAQWGAREILYAFHWNHRNHQEITAEPKKSCLDEVRKQLQLMTSLVSFKRRIWHGRNLLSQLRFYTNPRRSQDP